MRRPPRFQTIEKEVAERRDELINFSFFFWDHPPSSPFRPSFSRGIVHELLKKKIKQSALVLLSSVPPSPLSPSDRRDQKEIVRIKGVQ